MAAGVGVETSELMTKALDKFPKREEGLNELSIAL
jgi:hypothetical protein